MEDEQFLDELFKDLDALNDMQDKILLELAKVPQNNHTLSKSELKSILIPESISGNYGLIEGRFNTAFGILNANEFIKVFDYSVCFGNEGFKLFEILSDEEIKKPYTSYIERKKKRRRDKDQLLYYLVENEKLQSELIPILREANKSIPDTNDNIRNTNTNTTNANRNLIRIFTATAAIATVSLLISSVSLFRDWKVDKLNKRLQLKDSLIESQSKVIYRLLNK